MAIRIPTAGSIVYATFSVSTQAALAAGLETNLVAAGWTAEDIGASVYGTFTGAGANNETITVAGSVYTLKTTINNANAREVLIGASATATASNLAAAINAGAGSGTTYSSATTAHASVTASASAGVITVTSIAVGIGVQFTVSEAVAELSWINGTAVGSGVKLTSAATDDGRQMVVKAMDAGFTNEIRFIVESVDGTFKSLASLYASGPNMSLRVASGRTLSIAACAHQFVTWLASDAATLGTMSAFVCPYVPEHLQGIGPTGISSVTNATPIVITTSAAHGLTTGQYVDISNVLGNTAANGHWQVTVTNSTTFSLDGSTGNGAWTSGTGVIAGPGKIAQIFFCSTDANTSGDPTSYGALRKGLNGTYSANTGIWVVNDYTLVGVPFAFVYAKRGDGAVLPIFGSSYWLSEARIAWPYTSGAGQMYELGELWAAFLVGEAGTLLDTTKTGFNGHDWTLYSKASDASLWIATN